MTNLEFVEKVLQVRAEVPTVYALGMWGQRITKSIIAQKAKQLPRWYTPAKIKQLESFASLANPVYGFDCIGLIKGILWGFSADATSKTGGAKYASNGVKDIGADGAILSHCLNVSSDFSSIVVGEVVWIKGHIGVYVGNGQVVECSPKWANGVQFSNLGNLNGYAHGNFRVWTKHGMLEYLDYTDDNNAKAPIEVTKDDTDKMDNEDYIYERLIDAGFSPVASAAICGNIKAESNGNPRNLQNSFEVRMGTSDDQYTEDVDSGKYTNFVNDSAGYGLVQWTYHSRKENLYHYVKSKKGSIGDISLQVDFLIDEISKYPAVMKVLRSSDDLRECVVAVLKGYERPASTGKAVQDKRYGYASRIYNRHEGGIITVDLVKVAKEVIAGKWGNGAKRKERLEKAGYDYSKVQKLVNVLIKK